MLEQNKQKITQNLDLKGLACPLPLLKMKLALKKLESGQLMYIETTDSGSWADFHKFSEITENTLVSADLVSSDLVSVDKTTEYYRFIIKKGL
ncbi:MAG: sulfurtransferase TusA family protein [Oleispira antarctica]|nr:sulfurtransferase TusA family protein [Oleispira antarctica]MBQ0791996.1 sulfurtransferase TusA family protein [Oleispira antarctica]